MGDLPTMASNTGSLCLSLIISNVTIGMYLSIYLIWLLCYIDWVCHVKSLGQCSHIKLRNKVRILLRTISVWYWTGPSKNKIKEIKKVFILEGRNKTAPTCCCSVAKSRLTLCHPMDCSTPGFSVLNYLLEFAQTHGHWDAIQTSHTLLYASPTLNISQLQCLFQWVDSLHQVAKVLELQLQHQSFQWLFRVDFL